MILYQSSWHDFVYQNATHHSPDHPNCMFEFVVEVQQVEVAISMQLLGRPSAFWYGFVHVYSPRKLLGAILAMKQLAAQNTLDYA